MHIAISIALYLALQPVHVDKTVLADGIYQFTSAPDGYVQQLNSVAIVTDRDVLVFDTDTRPSTARTILAEIRKITPKPVRYVVNSHWHPDHWSGNEIYAQAYPDLEIISTHETRAYMRNIANAWPARWPVIVAMTQTAVDSERTTSTDTAQIRKDVDELKLYREYAAEAVAVHRTYPTLTFSDSLTLYHGGREFHLASVTGDAVGTTVLYLPKERILLTGDAVSYPIPYTRPSPALHAQSLRALSRLDVQIIVPGHGPALRDKNYLNLEAELLEAVTAQVQAALERGIVKVGDVQKAVDVDSLRPRFTHGDPALDDEFAQRVHNIARSAYLAGRDGLEWQ
jgi:cyclase